MLYVVSQVRSKLILYSRQSLVPAGGWWRPQCAEDGTFGEQKQSESAAPLQLTALVTSQGFSFQGLRQVAPGALHRRGDSSQNGNE